MNDFMHDAKKLYAPEQWIHRVTSARFTESADHMGGDPC